MNLIIEIEKNKKKINTKKITEKISKILKLLQINQLIFIHYYSLKRQ